MANTIFYEAKLKAQRWIEPIHLGPGDVTILSRDMGAIVGALDMAGQEIKRLKSQLAALRSRRRPANPYEVKDLRKLAVQIAEKAGEGPLSVYRGAKGGIAWCAPRSSYEGELIGTYDHGADWRDILADLQA